MKLGMLLVVLLACATLRRLRGVSEESSSSSSSISSGAEAEEAPVEDDEIAAEEEDVRLEVVWLVDKLPELKLGKRRANVALMFASRLTVEKVEEEDEAPEDDETVEDENVDEEVERCAGEGSPEREEDVEESNKL